MMDLIAAPLARLGVHPHVMTLGGLGIGLGAVPLLQAHQFNAALACILVNRLCDGLDGALARRRAALAGHSPTAYGAYLDIVCDMLFYGAIVLGMTLALPDHAFWSVLLLFGFLGTSSSFLAYAAVSKDAGGDGRGLFFLSGLVEGTETIFFFIAFCKFYYIYPFLAAAFTALCFLTTAIRMAVVAKKLGSSEQLTGNS